MALRVYPATSADPSQAADTVDGSPGNDEAAWSCPAGFDSDRLGREVIAMYERVARAPSPDDFHFHLGADYAASRLGYVRNELAELPDASTRRFAGVGNPLLAGPVVPGSVVLDHACGAGTDLLLAMLRQRWTGRGIGVDITPGMREVARQSAREMNAGCRVDIVAGSFDALPIPDQSIDLVLSNGVLNLAIDKLQVLLEARRVLRPGGSLYLADVVLARRLSPLTCANPALWSACVGGALTEADLLLALEGAQLSDVRVVARHDPFAGTSLHHKFGGDLMVSSVTLSARKPA